MNTPALKAMATSGGRNGGMIETIGFYPTTDEAQSAALAYGATKVGDYRNLHWKQFSDTTWGLMNGGIYTYIRVSRIASKDA